MTFMHSFRIHIHPDDFDSFDFFFSLVFVNCRNREFGLEYLSVFVLNYLIKSVKQYK